MASAEKEKKQLAIQITSLGTSSGNVTPTCPSSGNVTLDDADKTLEAMGYTPVRFSRPPFGVVGRC
jgi:hypothetical protein